MGVNPLILALITLTKLWTPNGEIMDGPVPVPVDSPIDESCRNSLAGLAIPETLTELPTKTFVPDGQPSDLDGIFSKVLNSYINKDFRDILPTDVSPNSMQNLGARSLNSLDSGLKPSNGFGVLPLQTTKTMNCKDILSLLLGRNLPKRTTQLSGPEYAVYGFNSPFKQAIDVTPKLYLQQIALRPVAFTNTPNMEERVFNPNALFVSPVNQFLPPLVNFMDMADNNGIGARSLMNPSTTDLSKLPISETNSGIDDIAGRMLMNPNIIELAEPSIPAKRNSDIVDNIQGRMLTNPEIIELAKPSVPAKRNSDIVDDIQGRMLANPNIIELAKPSVPAKRNSDIVDDIQGRMLTNPNIIELAKPSVPAKRNSDIVDDIQGRMLTNPNIIELAKPSVPAKRNSDIVDDIQGRMLTNPNIIELAKPSVSAKRNCDIIDGIQGRMLTNPNIIELAKPSVPAKRNSDIVDDIQGRMLTNPNIIELAKPSFPAKRNSDIVDDIHGRMLTNPNIIELAKPSVPAKRNSHIVDDIQSRMLTNPNTIELAKPSVPAKRNSDIVDDIQGRMLTNPHIIELAKPSVPAKRNSDIVDDIQGRMLANPNIIELAKPFVPAKRNSDSVDDIQGRMLTNPFIIELSKTPVVNNGQKRSLGGTDLNEASNSNRNIREQMPAGLDPLGVSPSFDTSIEKGVNEIAQLPYKITDSKLDISNPTSGYRDSAATNTIPVAIIGGEINDAMSTTESNIPRSPSSRSLSNLEGRIDIISSTSPRTETEGSNLEDKTDSAANINPVSNTAARMDSSEPNVDGRMDNIPVENPSPERTDMSETNIEGRMDTFDSSSKAEGEPSSSRKTRMDTKDLTDTLRSNESPMSNMKELPNIQGRMDDTGTQIDDKTDSNPINSSVLSTEYRMDDLTQSGNSRIDSIPNINPVTEIEGRMDDLSQQESTIEGSVVSTSSEIQPLKARTKDSVSINDSNSASNFSPSVPVEIKTDGSVPDYNIPAIAETVDSSLSNEETKSYPPLSIDGRMDISESVVEGKIDSPSNNNSAVIPEARMDDTATDIEGTMDNSPSVAESQELKSLTEKDNVPEVRSDFSDSTIEGTLATSTVASSR